MRQELLFDNIFRSSRHAPSPKAMEIKDKLENHPDVKLFKEVRLKMASGNACCEGISIMFFVQVSC